MYLNAVRVLRKKMDFGFGDTLIPNIRGIGQFFNHDPIFGYVERALVYDLLFAACCGLLYYGTLCRVANIKRK